MRIWVMSQFGSGYWIELLNVYFPPEWLKAALVLSLLSTWVLVALFAYLNQYTQRRYFTLWTIAWLFYALWLTASLNLQDAPDLAMATMLTQSCIGVCALFLLWGNMVMLQHHVRQEAVFGAIIAVLLWSYIGAYELHDPFWLKLPLFLLLGLASLFSSYLFLLRRLKRRYVGASVLSLGFLLWGLYLMAYPVLYARNEFASSGFLLSANLQLVIAFGMVVLVLEEVRYESRMVRTRLRQDVQRARVLENAVVASEEKYRTLFSNASDAILLVDTETLRILETNPAGCGLVGRPREAVLRCKLTDLCPALKEQYNRIVDNPRQLREAIESSVHLVFPRPDGTQAVAEGRVMPCIYGKREALQVCLRDLSERIKLERQLQQAEKLSALGQLISGVAHELNNPLAVIMGRAQLIMTRGNLDPKLKADISLMNHESERASRIVQRLLAFARPQPPQREFVQLNEVILHVQEMLKTVSANQNIELISELDPNLPPTMADAFQIEQVLMNLVQNARQAILGMAEAHEGHIWLRTEGRGKTIRISVTDDGPGIAPQHLNKIFDPFFTTKPFGIGTGLGLSICYGIVKEHGGQLSVQSEPGKGASFLIELPVVSRQALAPPETTAPPFRPVTPAELAGPAVEPPPCRTSAEHEPRPHGTGGNNGDPTPTPVAPPGDSPSVTAAGRKSRILLVDDEPAIAGVLSELLSCSNYEVESATNGQQALALLDQRSFDLIISDLKMPGMDGRELFRHLQQSRPNMTRRIIFLTGDTVSGDTREFLDGLGTPWLSKPFNITEVEETVRSSLEKATALAA